MSNHSPKPNSEDLNPTTGKHEAGQPDQAALPPWPQFGVQLLAGMAGGLVAGLTVLLLFRGLYALSFAVADTFDGWFAFGVFAAGTVISIVLSGLLGGLAGSLLSGLIVRRLWRPSRRWLVSWAVTWMVGSASLSLYVLGSGADPAGEMVAGAWWVILGGVLSLAFALIAPPWRYSTWHR
jgi:hypothetical protein